MPAIAVHVLDKLGWIAASLVSRRVDEKIRVFHYERERLAEPWHANMAAENAKLGKFQRDPIEIRNRPTWFRLAQWSCVSDLRAKWNIELTALCKQWIIAAVVRRKTPKPGQNAQPFEAIPLHPEPQLPHRFHGAKKIDGCNTDEAIRICPTVLCNLVVADHRSAWTVPCAEHTNGDAGTIHLGKRGLDGMCGLRPRAGPPSTQRVEHRIPDPLGVRMLHPSIDDHIVLPETNDELRQGRPIVCPPRREGRSVHMGLVVVPSGPHRHP